MKEEKKSEKKILAENKKAYFDYEIISKYEAGIELFGYEVKQIRSGKISLRGSFLSFINGELFLKGANVTPLGSLQKVLINPFRDRKIFLHKKELKYLEGKSKEGGFTLIPLKVYLLGSLIKVKVSLARGKKKFEKKQSLKEKDLRKEAEKFMKRF